VGQYLYVSRRPRFWAWLIVGGFYDPDDKELWHTEIFLAHHDRRGWSPETGEFDEGPPPPDRALEGQYRQYLGEIYRSYRRGFESIEFWKPTPVN